MKSLNILFLGASKRVSLIERFIQSSIELGIKLAIYSCEKELDFYPISHLATILKGPKFISNDFQRWLKETIKNQDIHIIIPNMDSATVALSEYALSNNAKNVWPVVSSYELCYCLNNKKLANKFFLDNNLPIPSNRQHFFPKIAKPLYGFGSKGILILENEKEYKSLFEKNSASQYVIQDYINGQETTVDFYMSPKKGLIGYVLRDRKEVSDGEVMVCTTRQPDRIEEELIKKITNIAGWVGCITIQYIRDQIGNLYLLEINPRFGGGATCSIEAGLGMPNYILCEYLNLNFESPKSLKSLKMTRARRDFFHGI
jgi:carbamoyl-phosphate synthase large subunit